MKRKIDARDLYGDVLCEIIEFLSWEDAKSFRLVCREWKASVDKMPKNWKTRRRIESGKFLVKARSKEGWMFRRSFPVGEAFLSTSRLSVNIYGSDAKIIVSDSSIGIAYASLDGVVYCTKNSSPNILSKLRWNESSRSIEDENIFYFKTDCRMEERCLDTKDGRRLYVSENYGGYASHVKEINLEIRSNVRTFICPTMGSICGIVAGRRGFAVWSTYNLNIYVGGISWKWYNVKFACIGAFHSGDRFVFCYANGSVIVYDEDSGNKVTEEICDHGFSAATIVSFAGDDRIATFCEDGRLRIFDASTAELLGTSSKIEGNFRPNTMAWNGNELFATTCEGEVLVLH